MHVLAKEVIAETHCALKLSAYACREVQSPSQMTTATIIERIVRNRENYEARNAKKSVSEAAYYKDKKQYVNEI